MLGTRLGVWPQAHPFGVARRMLCSASHGGTLGSRGSHRAACVGHRILERPGAPGAPAESQTVIPQILVCMGLNPIEADPFAAGMCFSRNKERCLKDK